MKNITITNSKGLKLAAVLYPNKSKPMVIISHGFASTKNRPRHVRAAKLFSKDYAVLRFDFGGCGDSDKRPITLKSQLDDFKSVINYVKKQGYHDIIILGESLGALTALKINSKVVKGYLLWAPVTKPKINFGAEHELKDLYEKPFVNFMKHGKEFVVAHEYLKERQSVNQKNLLSKVTCPVFIIHGDKDVTVSINDSKDALKYLKNARLVVIKGLGHIFDSLEATKVTYNILKTNFK